MLIFNAFFSAFIVGLAYICQFSVFVNTPFFLLWITFYTAICGFNAVSMFMVRFQYYSNIFSAHWFRIINLDQSLVMDTCFSPCSFRFSSVNLL